MFINIDNRLDSMAVRNILSLCLFDGSPEGRDKAMQKYPGENYYGWVENGEVLGLCGFLPRNDAVVICHISVAERYQRCSIGRKMVNSLFKKYGLKIEAETDDDAVEFYRKCGFETTAIQKYGVRRWKCVLHAPKPLDQITDKERTELFPVVLSEHNPEWKTWFADEKERLILHCPDCGKKLIQKEIGNEGKISFCNSCNKPLFPFSYPCVIYLIVDKDNHVALIKQSYVSDRFICVAGFVKQGETIETTAKREVEEETGLSVLSVKYINSYYHEKRDNLMLGFVCTVEHSDFTISCEVDSAEWFALEEAEAHLRQGSVGQDLLRDYMRMVRA